MIYLAYFCVALGLFIEYVNIRMYVRRHQEANGRSEWVLFPLFFHSAGAIVAYFQGVMAVVWVGVGLGLLHLVLIAYAIYVTHTT